MKFISRTSVPDVPRAGCYLKVLKAFKIWSGKSYLCGWRPFLRTQQVYQAWLETCFWLSFFMAASQPWHSIPEPELWKNIHPMEKGVILVDNNHSPPNETAKDDDSTGSMIHMITFCRLQKGCWTVKYIKYIQYQLTVTYAAKVLMVTSLTLFAFFTSWCSQKNPTVEMSSKNCVRPHSCILTYSNLAIQHGLFKASFSKGLYPWFLRVLLLAW